jgi:hypothetical protein
MFLALLVVLSLSCFISLPNSYKNYSAKVDLECSFDVKSLNFENHTVTATLDLEIYGIQNQTIGGVSQKPNFIILQVSDSYNDELNCTFAHDFGNGTYSYRGILEDANWYLYSYGEGFPFDPNYLQFNIIHMDFTIGNARYGASTFENYSYNILKPKVEFSGINNIDLTNNWRIDFKINNEFLDVTFNRNSLTATLIIMTPLAWLLFLSAIAPSIIEDRKTRIELYSALLVFTPMFIFAIESFIPARGSPSIPEFLSIVLLLLTTCFLSISLIKLDGERLLKGDKIIFEVLSPFIIILAVVYFSRLVAILWLSIFVIIGLLSALLVVGYYFRVTAFKKLKKREEDDAKAKFEIV